MIIKILLIAAVLIIVFAIVVALRPSDFRVSRSAAISAPPAVLFEQVNDLHKWQEMSPYARLDPTAKYHFDGAPAGPGASLAWEGGNKVGAGKMTIVESERDECVKMQLDFLRPFRATNAAEFTFTPAGDHTNVTWSMSGKSNFFCKAIGLFIDCDKMCGPQFEEGLANLKRIAEAQAQRSTLQPRFAIN